jgi:transcriptional regulator with XRE-family HTH domain
MTTLPTALRGARKARKWTQEQASMACGMTFYRYRRLETAYDRPTAEETDVLARVFGLSPRSLAAASRRTVLMRETIAAASAGSSAVVA